MYCIISYIYKQTIYGIRFGTCWCRDNSSLLSSVTEFVTALAPAGTRGLVSDVSTTAGGLWGRGEDTIGSPEDGGV